MSVDPYTLSIVDRYDVRGRGLTVIVKNAPRGLVEGCLVHQGRDAWRIANILRSGSTGTASMVLRPLRKGSELQAGAVQL